MKKTPTSHIQPATGTSEDWSPPYISKTKSSSYKKFHKRSNDRKGRYTLAHF